MWCWRWESNPRPTDYEPVALGLCDTPPRIDFLGDKAMPRVKANGIELEYAEAGEGYPLVLCHEFGGSMESWAPQVHFFARRYRVITYNARGYPPSDVPKN